MKPVMRPRGPGRCVPHPLWTASCRRCAGNSAGRCSICRYALDCCCRSAGIWVLCLLSYFMAALSPSLRLACGRPLRALFACIRRACMAFAPGVPLLLWLCLERLLKSSANMR